GRRLPVGGEPGRRGGRTLLLGLLLLLTRVAALLRVAAVRRVAGLLTLGWLLRLALLLPRERAAGELAALGLAPRDLPVITAVLVLLVETRPGRRRGDDARVEQKH